MFDLVGDRMNEWVEDFDEVFVLGAVVGVEEDGPGDAVVAADEEGGGAVEEAGVPDGGKSFFGRAHLPAIGVVGGFGLALLVKAGVFWTTEHLFNGGGLENGRVLGIIE